MSVHKIVSQQEHVISSFCFFSSQIIKKQSALQCRVERQISVELIRLVESKKDVSLSAEARSADALVKDKLTSNCHFFAFSGKWRGSQLS